MTTKDERFEKLTELIDGIGKDEDEVKSHNFIENLGDYYQAGYVRFTITEPNNATELLEKINELASKLDDVELPYTPIGEKVDNTQIAELIKISKEDTKIIKQIKELIVTSDAAEIYVK